MIKELSIQNLQSHKDTTIQFSEGVNVIVGQSDAGKSAIIRALRWVIENRPLGDTVHSSWGGETVVGVTTDKTFIERSKYKRDQYLLSGIEKPFRAFGTSVPVEIKDALNLDVINTQFQIDPHFLFSKSPGEVATFFNRIANLEVLDKSRNNIEKTINSIESGIKYDKGQLKLKEQQLTEFEYLEKFEIELDVLTYLEEERNGISSQISKISALLKNIESTQENLQLLKEEIKAEKDIDIVLQWIDQRDANAYEIKVLSDSLFDINASKIAIRLKSKVLKAEPKVKEILGYLDQRKTLETEVENLESFLYNITKAKANLKQSRIKILAMEKEFKEAMPDVCPLCGTNLKTNKTHNHESNRN